MTVPQEFKAGAFLVISLGVVSLYAWGAREKQLRLKVEAENAQVILECDGFRAAAEAVPKEVLKLVPVLAPLTPLPKVVVPVASSHMAASTTLVVPCPEPVPGSVSALDAVPLVTEPILNRTVPVALTFTHDLLITRIKFGNVEWKDAVAGTATINGTTTPLDFPEGSVVTHVAVSKDILDQLHAHEVQGNWLRRHFKGYVGVGGNYNLLNQRVDVGIQVGYGYVF